MITLIYVDSMNHKMHTKKIQEMDYFQNLPYLSTVIAGLFALALLSFFLVRNKKLTDPSKNKPPPMAAGAWPILGHLHLLGGSQLPHKTLGSLADKFGPIFSIRLGAHRAVVVSSWEIAKECYTTHDAAVASRPKFAAAKYLAYNYAVFAFSPHGAHWREMRKIATSELLSNRRTELMSHLRVSQVESSVKDLYKLWQHKKDESGHVLVDMQRWFADLSFNIILRMIANKQYDVNDKDENDQKRRLQKAVREFFHYTGMSVTSDAFPFLEWLDIGGHIKIMKRIAKEMDCILSEWLDEHRAKKGSSKKTQDEQDFLDVMISAVDGKDLDDDYDDDTIIKSSCLTMIVGATDTSTVTITWAISLLLNNPHALKKAQEELDSVIGSDRLVKESDIGNLVYLHAIVKETLRLYPPAPLLVARELIEDCTIGGYHIPKGTRLIPNAWKIQNDPRVWFDPSAFKPERFLTTHKDIDVRGQHYELIPFGTGRRGCPGASFSLPIVHLALANFLHAFDVSTPSNEQIDMTESFGLTNMRATPLDVIVKPRVEFAI